MKRFIHFFRKPPGAAPARVTTPLAVSEHAWNLPSRTEAGAQSLARVIAAWAGRSIDGLAAPARHEHLALALSCRDARGRILHSDALGLFRPADFVVEEGAARVETFIATAHGHSPGEGAHIVGALLRVSHIGRTALQSPRA